MPPRYAFWTILIDGKATAFRAREKDELLPTFAQLKRTNKDVVFKWFARGRLWETPEESQAALRAPKIEREKRGGAWRPGGAHADPRERFKKKSGARSHDTRPKPADGAPVFKPDHPRPPHKYGSRPSGPRPSQPWRDKPSGPPRGDRPWSSKPPTGSPPRGDRRPWSNKPPGGSPPRGDRPWSNKPPTGSPPRGDRPWSNKPPTGSPPRGDRRPWSSKPRGARPVGLRRDGPAQPKGPWQPDRPPDRREHRPPPSTPRPEPEPEAPPAPESIKTKPDPPERG